MSIETIKPILVSCVKDDAPIEALFQARDIFEMILMAHQNSSDLPPMNLASTEEETFVRSLLSEMGIHDEINFVTLLGCADLLMNTESETQFFQARRLFRILLNSL
jgi:hypothetical protein